jgi:hypothetical protein
MEATTGGPVGLRQHRRDLVTGRRKARQSPLSELGRTGED